MTPQNAGGVIVTAPEQTAVQDPTTAATLATIERFNGAFHRHDVDAVMALMTDDVTYRIQPAPVACVQR